MANFSKTISNRINVFGGSPSSRWNQYNWNAFKWGQSTTPLIWTQIHFLSNSLSPDSAISQKNTARYIYDTLSPSSDMASETLRDANGYYYVFVSDTIDAENRDIASYVTASNRNTSWTTAIAGSTTWS